MRVNHRVCLGLIGLLAKLDAAVAEHLVDNFHGIN